ncbi:MAG: serine hydroxymethyltransferase [Armatimonadetes bacterium]|nr:serine hydroxymethyltransferase [Armatimonadota bacterium]
MRTANPVKAVHRRQLSEVDPEVFEIIGREEQRQEQNLELIASENIASTAVREATACVMTDKYAEGVPGKRYYGGCEHVDEAERLAISRVKEIFGSKYANVQPHSGAQANMAVYHAFMKPGDTLMGLALTDGGHLTHGSPVAFSGQMYNIASYGLKDDETIDYDDVRAVALAAKPQIIVSGASAYSRAIDFAFFTKVAEEVGAIHMSDIAHYAGLIAGGVYPNPAGVAHIITSTTHKSLRGPRGGIILWDDKEYSKAIRMSVFPGLQGGPLMHVIAAKAVAFGLCLQPNWKEYAAQVKTNAQSLAAALGEEGFRIVSGGTDSHLMLVDVRPFGITGKVAEEALDKANITTNKNTIPNDPEKPFVTSGVRLGTPAVTTRGMQEPEMKEIASHIAEVLRHHEDEDKIAAVKQKVITLCERFSIHGAQEDAHSVPSPLGEG